VAGVAAGSHDACGGTAASEVGLSGIDKIGGGETSVEGGVAVVAGVGAGVGAGAGAGAGAGEAGLIEAANADGVANASGGGSSVTGPRGPVRPTGTCAGGRNDGASCVKPKNGCEKN
jgi:hypothetical protein